MAPLAIALHLALAVADPASPAAAPAALAPPAPLRAITLVPRELDPGPFRAGEIAGATLGAFAGDVLVLGAGYLALQAFASGDIAPTATNFRRAVYALGVSALVVPPLTSVLLAKLGAGPHATGALWKAMLLASVGQAVALAAGYYAAPRFWIVLPVQAIALSVGASLGLHWGPRSRAPDEAEDDPGALREPAEPTPATAALWAMPVCAGS